MTTVPPLLAAMERILLDVVQGSGQNQFYVELSCRNAQAFNEWRPWHCGISTTDQAEFHCLGNVLLYVPDILIPSPMSEILLELAMGIQLSRRYCCKIFCTSAIKCHCVGLAGSGSTSSGRINFNIGKLLFFSSPSKCMQT